MPAGERRKGIAAEREFARLIGGHRVPLSGAQEGYPGDVVGLGLVWSIKRRADGWRTLYAELEDHDALAVRADRRPWLVVMTLETYLRQVGGRDRDEG